MCNVSCCFDGEVRPSTLPPPCYHCRPPRFCCPKNGCPPPQPYPPWPRCPEPCPPLICRPKPCPPSPPPSICIARPCPEPPRPPPHCCPPPPKIIPLPSNVTFCIRYTCEGPTYCPCYSPGVPCCPTSRCC